MFFLKATGFAVFFVGFKLMEIHEIPQRRFSFPGNLIVDVELVQMFPKLSQYWRNSGRCFVFNQKLGGGFKYFFNFHPNLGKIPNLTNIFQLVWFNHQLENPKAGFLP